jgi:hypothetical protein
MAFVSSKLNCDLRVNYIEFVIEYEIVVKVAVTETER